jgi:hypothetical protein
VHKAEVQLETATRGLTVARKISAAAEIAFTRSTDREQIARGIAHKPVYEAGIKARLAAAQAGDKAKADLAAVFRRAILTP